MPENENITCSNCIHIKESNFNDLGDLKTIGLCEKFQMNVRPESSAENCEHFEPKPNEG